MLIEKGGISAEDMRLYGGRYWHSEKDPVVSNGYVDWHWFTQIELPLKFKVKNTFICSRKNIFTANIILLQQTSFNLATK